MEARRRNVAGARRLYRQALQADPAHPQSLVGLGQLEARSGNAEAARAVYQRGLAAHPRSVHLLSSLAHLESQVGGSGARARRAAARGGGLGRRGCACLKCLCSLPAPVHAAAER
jgi:Flp pilus assembly protein TadD